MPIKVTCSQCGGVLHAPDDSSGKRGRCPTCGTVLTILGEFVGPQTAAASPQFGAPPAPQSQRQTATPPVTNPWGSLPGGPEEQGAGVQLSGLPAAPPARPTYEFAKEQPPSRPGVFPAPTEPVPTARGSRVPPDPRKLSVQDPFAKPGKPNDEQSEANAKWAKVYRGLGWVRTGILFCLLGTLGYAAVPALQAFNVSLPNQSPGYLKIADFSQSQEIRLFATLGPLLLGLLCVALGRIGVAGAPAASYARGPATFASLATLACLGGFIAVAVITGLAMKDGFIPQFTPELKKLESEPTLVGKATIWSEGVFLSGKEMTGQIQGFGSAALIVFGLLAEVWFVAALGRMAAALRHGPAAGRVNRFVLLVGVLFAVKVALCLAARVYYPAWFEANAWSKWDGLDDKAKALAPLAAVALGGLVFAILYWRMVGGVKTAIRENVDIGA